MFNIPEKRLCLTPELTNKIGEPVICYFCKHTQSIFWRKHENNTICESCWTNPTLRNHKYIQNVDKQAKEENEKTEKNSPEYDSNSQGSSNEEEVIADAPIKEPRKKIIKLNKPKFKKISKPKSRHAIFNFLFTSCNFTAPTPLVTSLL